MSNAELATSYAALILADDGVDITVRALYLLKCDSKSNSPQADKINTLIKAAKVEDVEPIWATLFAKVPPSNHGSIMVNSKAHS
jgi:large subunit ribosomal protein LP1